MNSTEVQNPQRKLYAYHNWFRWLTILSVALMLALCTLSCCCLYKVCWNVSEVLMLAIYVFGCVPACVQPVYNVSEALMLAMCVRLCSCPCIACSKCFRSSHPCHVCLVVFLPVYSLFKMFRKLSCLPCVWLCSCPCIACSCFRRSHACHMCSILFLPVQSLLMHVFQKLSYLLCRLCLSLSSLTLPQTVRLFNISLHS